MKVQNRVSLGLFLLTLLTGCGADNSNSLPLDGTRRVPLGSRGTDAEGNQVVLPVIGSASFGSQCPHGYVAPPQPSPIELVTTNTSLTTLELGESLSPLVLQVDCKKNTIDIRGVTRTAPATTWEFPPSGLFDFNIEGGMIQVKNDGAGNLNCSTPSLVEIRGKIDCKEPDFPVIRAYFFWNLGRSIRDLSASPHPQSQPGSPGPSPSAVPSAVPSTTPSPSPAPLPTPAPSATTSPNPAGISQPTPPASPPPQPTPTLPPAPAPTRNPFGFHFPFPFFRSQLNDEASSAQISCKFSEDSYLQTPQQIEIKQCAN